jgi:hypothetical protein
VSCPPIFGAEIVRGDVAAVCQNAVHAEL